MSGAERYAPEWLALREPADGAARAPELLDPLRAHLATATGPADRLLIRDLGCGTGSMGRWLAGRLPGPQHWIMHDNDPELLDRAGSTMADTAADGSPVTVATRQLDITRLTAEALAGTSLVTASALLDVLTADEVTGLVAACVEAGCPALFALSVLGRVELDPVDPLDAAIDGAFNDHQRRVAGDRRLLGPDAVTATAEAFTDRGATVHVRSSPWRLGPDQLPLTAEWLRGWVGAACAQRPDLAGHGQAYLRRRLAACAAGELRVVVQHSDLLALPAPPAGAAS
jgi:hypothetical protein